MSKITDLDFAVISELCDRYSVDHVKETLTENLGKGRRMVQINIATKDDIESYDWNEEYTRITAEYSVLDKDYKIDRIEIHI